jgi:TolB protein
MMNADGSEPKRLTFFGNYNQAPAWSPKGNIVAFMGRDERNIFDIFLLDVNDPTNVQRLTQDQGNNEDPSWSPDGRHIAFSSNRSGQYKVYIMNADGTNQRLISYAAGAFTSPSWSSQMNR